MTTIDDIKKAKSQDEVFTLVEKAAKERNCDLDDSLTYSEQCEFFRQEAPKDGNDETDMNELADILEASEKRWYEVE